MFETPSESLSSLFQRKETLLVVGESLKSEGGEDTAPSDRSAKTDDVLPYVIYFRIAL